MQISEHSEVDNINCKYEIPKFYKYPVSVAALYGSVVSFCAQVYPPETKVKWSICGRDVTDNARGILVSKIISILAYKLS